MERDLAWRVLEVPEDAGGAGAAAASQVGPPGVPKPDPRRTVALAALGISALLAAAVAAALVVAGPREGTLALDGSLAGTGAGAGTVAPDAALVAGQGLVVDVAGAVLHPGVYHLPAGSRVADAITAAGGFGPRVDALAAQALNLAAPLTDGVQVRVPSRDDATARGTGSPGTGGGGSGSGGGSGGPVDLNTATAAELDSLPGIGPVTAAKIVASREGQAFSAVTELQTRKLVGASTFAKLAGLVTVGGR